MTACESTTKDLMSRSLRVFARFCKVFEIGFKIVVSNRKCEFIEKVQPSRMQLFLSPPPYLKRLYA